MSQLAGLLGTPSVIAFNSIEEEWVTFPWRSLNGIVRINGMSLVIMNWFVRKVTASA